jgi:hypothetical protein
MYEWLPKDERNRLLRKEASDAIAWIRDYYANFYTGSNGTFALEYWGNLSKKMLYESRSDIIGLLYYDVTVFDDKYLESEKCNEQYLVAKTAILSMEE